MLIDSIPVGCPQFSIGQSSYWLETPTEPLFPFGYGLSYTTFEYGSLHIDTLRSGKEYDISCTITNTGNFDAYETPQLYVRQLCGELVRPICELKGFSKIFIPAGESRMVIFRLTPDMLAYWHEQKHNCQSKVWLATDKVSFSVWIAPDSRCMTASGTFQIR